MEALTSLSGAGWTAVEIICFILVVKGIRTMDALTESIKQLTGSIEETKKRFDSFEERLTAFENRISAVESHIKDFAQDFRAAFRNPR